MNKNYSKSNGTLLFFLKVKNNCRSFLGINRRERRKSQYKKNVDTPVDSNVVDKENQAPNDQLVNADDEHVNSAFFQISSSESSNVEKSDEDDE